MKAKKGSGQMRDAHSSTAKDWRNFQVVVNKCDTATAAESKQCLMEARDTYRAWNLNCETLAPEDKAQCTRYIDRWTSALPNAPHANTPAVRSGEPNTIPADRRSEYKERNRDSTKQQAATQQPRRRISHCACAGFKPFEKEIVMETAERLTPTPSAGGVRRTDVEQASTGAHEVIDTVSDAARPLVDRLRQGASGGRYDGQRGRSGGR
jgi:hypothetical protein